MEETKEKKCTMGKWVVYQIAKLMKDLKLPYQILDLERQFPNFSFKKKERKMFNQGSCLPFLYFGNSVLQN